MDGNPSDQTKLTSSDSSRGDTSAERLLRSFVKWLVFFSAALFGAVFLFGATSTIYYEAWVLDLAREHFAATVGLPFAALAALCLVILLEISTGKIELRGLGFEFKGRRWSAHHVDFLFFGDSQRDQNALVDPDFPTKAAAR